MTPSRALTFEWQNSDEVLCTREGIATVWHGIRARRRDYADASRVEAAVAAEFEKISIRPVNRARLDLTAREVRTHAGVKIGGLPFWFKDDDPEQNCQGDFLCSLSDVVSNPWADKVLRSEAELRKVRYRAELRNEKRVLKPTDCNRWAFIHLSRPHR
jgi:hypothetical protein